MTDKKVGDRFTVTRGGIAHRVDNGEELQLQNGTILEMIAGPDGTFQNATSYKVISGHDENWQDITGLEIKISWFACVQME